MKISGGTITIELEKEESSVLLKILGGLSINNCRDVIGLTEDEIKVSDVIYKEFKGFTNPGEV